ncbi:DUF309 domain-containing protein [Mesorhizobium sp. M0195]|uniref:DUF309 domain-containing protein n=1 Tax=Mesorhizobium sp. M0195 TaxID=2956910 RepID=UPI0033367F49
MRIFPAGSRILCATLQDTAITGKQFRLLKRRHLTRTCSSGVSTSGYYWEAHEAWEGLWQVADRGAPLRMLFKGLILLSAAGVKIREGKHAAAVRHAGRAAALLRRLMNAPDRAIERALGMSLTVLAEQAEAAARIPAALQATQPQAVFDFILGSRSRGMPIRSQKRNSHS